MKRKVFTTTLLVCCFAVCLAAIADLTGKWAGTLKTPDGEEMPVNYTFKANGDKLTGNGASPDGDIPIKDGKINGADFSFTVTYNGTDIKNTGKFYAEADSVALDIDFNGTKMHTTLKRANK
jgi:hypothetical protein